MNPINYIAKQFRKLTHKDQEKAKAAVTVLSVLVVGTLVLRSVFAASVSLYLSPASSTVIQNNTIAVAVRVNTGAEAVNAIQANLSYPAAQLEYVSTDNTGSAFPLVAETTGGGGSIRLARATNAGTPPVTGDQLVATITFKALGGSGSAAVSFASGSAVVRASDNTDVLTGTAGGTYSLTTPPVQPPPTSSTTYSPPASGSTPKTSLSPPNTSSPAVPYTSSPATIIPTPSSQSLAPGPLSVGKEGVPQLPLGASKTVKPKPKTGLLYLISGSVLIGVIGAVILSRKLRNRHTWEGFNNNPATSGHNPIVSSTQPSALGGFTQPSVGNNLTMEERLRNIRSEVPTPSDVIHPNKKD